MKPRHSQVEHILVDQGNEKIIFSHDAISYIVAVEFVKTSLRPARGTQYLKSSHNSIPAGVTQFILHTMRSQDDLHHEYQDPIYKKSASEPTWDNQE